MDLKYLSNHGFLAIATNGLTGYISMESELFSIHKDLNRLQLFELRKISDVYKKTTVDEFIVYIEYILTNNLKEEFKYFLYYLLLFRDEKNIQKFLNMENTPIKLVEHLIIYSYGYTTHKGGSADDIFDDLLFFFSNERLLQLLIESSLISRDKILLFFLLTKLNIQYIDKFFSKQTDIEKTIKSFLYLPDCALDQIIFRNVNLFDYILSILPVYADQSRIEDFLSKFDEEIIQIKKINELVSTLKKINVSDIDPKNNHYDLSRIAKIISIYSESDYNVKSLEMLNNYNVFTSPFEKSLFFEIISNPMFKSLFQKYKQATYFEKTEAIIF